jgi:hypothetical protein
MEKYENFKMRGRCKRELTKNDEKREGEGIKKKKRGKIKKKNRR